MPARICHCVGQIAILASHGQGMEAPLRKQLSCQTEFTLARLQLPICTCTCAGQWKKSLSLGQVFIYRRQLATRFGHFEFFMRISRVIWGQLMANDKDVFGTLFFRAIKTFSFFCPPYNNNNNNNE